MYFCNGEGIVKKTVASLVILLLSLCPVYAQFSWGTRTGVHFSTLHSFHRGNDRYEAFSRWNDWKSSVLVPGFYFDYRFNEELSLSTGLQFANKGYRWPGDQSTNNSSYIYHLPYVTVPLLVNLNLDRWSFFVGPEVGYKFLSSFEIGDTRTLDEEIFINSVDLGISGGVGYELAPGYRLSARYTSGITNVVGKNTEVSHPLGSFGNAREEGFIYQNRSVQLFLETSFRYTDQKEKKRQFAFDVRQGISSYTLFDTGVEMLNPQRVPIQRRVGYEAGLEMRITIKKYFLFGTGVNYLQQGGQLPGEEPLRVNYISVPIMIGISPIVMNDFSFSVQGGLGIHHQVMLHNPYRKYFTSDYDRETDFSSSLFYGFEAAIRISEKFSAFLNYRNHWGNASILEFDGLHISSKGYSISAGLRLHR